MHLNGGFTQVSLIRSEGQGLADGGVRWDIPTAKIPFHLRAVGSRFLLIAPRFTPEEHDSVDEIRSLRDQLEIRELSSNEGFTEYVA